MIVTFRQSLRWLGQQPRLLVELFVLVNLAGLAPDIYLAHARNEFALWEEWIPFYFSCAAPMLLLGAIISQYRFSAQRIDRALGWFVGGLAVAIGITGMILHMESSFFERQTLKNLVYTAPFAAPLAYAGLGLLLILNRTEDSTTELWARWVLLLAWGGFVGNFALSLADHAQNGFFVSEEWLSVAAAALAVGFFFVAAIMRPGRGFLWWCAGVLGLQVIVGLIGFGYHVTANLNATGPSLWYKFVYGAPAFAPLLFPNLALLAAIGLWAVYPFAEPSDQPTAEPASPGVPR